MSLDSYWFVDVGRPLWREIGSVVFNFSTASPAQPFTGLSPTGLGNILYCLYFRDSPNLEGQVPVFISPRNRVAQLYRQSKKVIPPKSKSCYDWRSVSQSVSMPWCRVHSGTCELILLSALKLLCCLCGAPSLTRHRACFLVIHPSIGLAYNVLARTA
jgi:hypothetical protein